MATGITGLLSRLVPRADGRARSPDGVSPDRFAGPIRGELLGTEGLAEYARALARQQRVLPPSVRGWAQKQRGQGPLLQRLDETRKLLDAARVTITDAADRGVDISPAGEWLLDNFYVVQEHVREVRASMPKTYYQELPKLAAGALAGYPRIYEVAIELIAHTEGYLKPENIDLFVREFQRGATLTTGELWATPTMLRLGLIENIRRMTLRVTQRLDELDSADKWAKRLREASEGGAQSLSAVLAEFVNDHPPLTPAFVSRFLQQIRSYQSNFTPLRWLEQWIAEDGLNAEDAVTKANQRLALTQVMMANSITSLRTIARLDWATWVESMNAIEVILRQDPARAYASMTFNSRDLYRHVIEDIAKRTGSTEVDIAERALDLARKAVGVPGVDQRLTHIGYYLVDDGVRELERAVAYTPPWREALHQWVLAHPELVYFGGITLFTAILVAIPFMAIGRVSIGAFLAVLALAIIPANDIAINIVHQLVTMLLPPRLLPKLDFEDGIPSAYRTAVVVPTLLGSTDGVKEALEHLEVQFLANRDPNIYFALLSDFTDSPTEARAGDDEILAAAVAGIRALNEKYAADTFFLFHRSRKWNEGEGAWLAWERKRGKLAQFNQFLRGGASDAFSTIVGDTAPLSHVVYVITLDSDTVLPRGGAALLVGAMAHPVNRAVYDPVSGRVVRGYGILQPRVGISLESANRSLFAAIASGRPGVDPYTTAVSDVYQDLFAEGSFTGKGIYDVDAFERATEDKFPENALLSHDLIEGTYARAALVTDVEFYDDYPTRYLTYTRRKHRWIRGDWQLLPWLFGRHKLSAISRWKIFDNLRRSVVEIAELGLLVAGWTVLPGGPFLWTALVLAGIATPFVFGIGLSVVSPPQGDSWRAYYKAVWRDAQSSIQQYLLLLTFLPHQAFVSADAISRTLWRMFVSHRKMLEWQTASQVERVMAAGRQPREVWRKMAPAEVVTAVILVIVLTTGIGHAHMVRLPTGLYHMGSAVRWWYLAVTMPLVMLWAVSPSIADSLSAPAVRRERRLTGAESWTALRYALLHWHFFDRFVTVDTQWLAPDNFQEDPSPVVAMRTSPTNIGLQLLGIVSAYDLGFLSSGAMIERLELVFRTLERMARFRGHFYNWYDLRDLQILEPAYISTVDSGNLAGDLIAIKQACLHIIDEPIVDSRIWDALQTALELAVENLRSLASSGDVSSPKQWQAVLEAGERVRAVLQSLPTLTGANNTEALTAKTLQTLADRLRAAERVVVERTEELANVDLVPGRDWIVWSRQHLERWAADVAAIGDGAKSLRQAAATSSHATEQVKRLEALAARAHEYAMEMDFRFLYDARRKLFSIGYQVSAGALDPSLYDLLASEARLASYVAIAKGDVQAEHWFKLGRGLTSAAGDTALISWSGSMFEYLMPALIMESFPFTLLDQTYTGAVRRQIAYGAERSVPWGVSESAYNARDRHQTYQYRAFGVPDLALKRGLSKDLVVAPYATLLALMIEPHAAMKNLGTLEKEGALGLFGFRDAVDYTRPAVGSNHALVGTYMAHHIGMSLVSLNNAIHSDIWPQRFHADPLVKSAELVLFERIPRRFVLSEAQTDEGDEQPRRRGSEKPSARTLDTPNTPEPRVTLLGHAPYTLMISNAGSGYSRFENVQVTRWRNDGTLDRYGQWCYLHDTSTGRVWPAAYQPMGDDSTPDWYRSTFASDRATFSRRDGDIDTRLEVTVVPDDAAEVRRVTVTNNGTTAKDIELTTYGEISLCPPDADRTHPAFQNLFVETEFVAPHGAILATRRPRSADERTLWCGHVVATGPEIVGRISCETDRAQFTGRNRTVRNPQAMAEAGALSGTTGAVLDPIFAMRVLIRVGAGQSARVAFTTLVAPTRDRALELADRYHDPYSAQRALDLSWMHAQVELRELSITPADAALYQELAGYLFFSDRAVRAPAKEVVQLKRGIDALWAHGISGDWPILLATVDQAAGVATVKELLQAHQYWRGKGMMVDLVILNTNPPSYQQDLQDELQATVLASTEAALIDKPGGVMLRRRDLIPPDDLAVLRATARVHVPCDGLRLAEILELPETEPEYPPAFEPTTQSGGGIVSAGVLAAAAARSGDGARGDALLRAAPPVAFDNGLGGLAADGSYQIRLADGATTPAPWTNVIANENGGFLISENGGGYVWDENSFFFRLTPWMNDPVSDEPTDILYIRDDETGEVWTPTPDPIRHQTPYLINHAPGRTEFRHSHAGLTTHLVLGMPEHDVVKIAKLSITNDTATPRRVTIAHYADWCLGVMREHTQHQIRTSFDRETEAMFAQNGYDQDFSKKVAFTALSLPVMSYTGDRREFIGRNGTLAAPAGLERASLAESCGPLLDPCAALEGSVSILPGETREIVALLGCGNGEAECRALIERYREGDTAIEEHVEAWRQRLTTIQVKTPDPACDAILNGWLLYQALACRFFARTALYQSSGAYGFRDQLQDSMAFVYSDPKLAREHILRSAGRQFVEGDVQHWWHAHNGRGVRTRFSDDLAWLPFVVDHYLVVTGDTSVLDEVVPFLTMRQLEPNEQELYDRPDISSEKAPVYEHCLRALRKATTVGQHGLPLMGIGDWNDGMNRVGVGGQGVSVWLAWFLIATCRRFAVHCDARGDKAAATELRAKADAYAAAIEKESWDGEWYRRAYFDDGTPLGSHQNDECQIDAIAQSWSVISGAGEPDRQRQAAESVYTHLVREDARLIELLTPPFDHTDHDPGYIKGYLPGVRENGAQYTHAATWTVLARALLGDGDTAYHLYEMLNPFTHPLDTYKVEPYVIAADVYTAEGHLGRGGWTWYTGSAAWAYRVGLEGILGFKKRGATLRLEPVIPAAWEGFELTYRYGSSTYHITVRKGDAEEPTEIALVDDGKTHEVTVTIAARDLSPLAR